MWTRRFYVFPSAPIRSSQQQSHFLPVSPLMHNFLSGQQRSLGKCVFLHSLSWCQATAESISKIQQASCTSDSISHPKDSKPPGEVCLITNLWVQHIPAPLWAPNLIITMMAIRKAKTGPKVTEIVLEMRNNSSRRLAKLLVE